MDALAALSPDEAERLAQLLESGRMSLESGALGIKREGFDGAEGIQADFLELTTAGFSGKQAAVVLRALGSTMGKNGNGSTVDLVASGPDAAGLARDTGVVVRDLFASAEKSILVVGFALHDGKTILKVLADRMDAVASLDVTMCLDISRSPGDTSTDEDVLARFAQRFKAKEWPGNRLPKIFYDPRALAAWPAPRAVLHAKCIVVDDRLALVTSANLTPAAQEDNIEIGLLVQEKPTTLAIKRHFDRLIEKGLLRRLGL